VRSRQGGVECRWNEPARTCTLAPPLPGCCGTIPVACVAPSAAAAAPTSPWLSPRGRTLWGASTVRCVFLGRGRESTVCDLFFRLAKRVLLPSRAPRAPPPRPQGVGLPANVWNVYALLAGGAPGSAYIDTCRRRSCCSRHPARPEHERPPGHPRPDERPRGAPAGARPWGRAGGRAYFHRRSPRSCTHCPPRVRPTGPPRWPLRAWPSPTRRGSRPPRARATWRGSPASC